MLPITPSQSAQQVGVLSQVISVLAAEVVLLTVPLANRIFVQELAVCNRGGVATSFRFSISRGGAATATKDYLYFDIPIGAHDTFASDLGVTLSASDTVRAFSPSGGLTFTLFGMLV